MEPHCGSHSTEELEQNEEIEQVEGGGNRATKVSVSGKMYFWY